MHDRYLDSNGTAVNMDYYTQTEMDRILAGEAHQQVQAEKEPASTGFQPAVEQVTDISPGSPDTFAGDTLLDNHDTDYPRRSRTSPGFTPPPIDSRPDTSTLPRAKAGQRSAELDGPSTPKLQISLGTAETPGAPRKPASTRYLQSTTKILDSSTPSLKAPRLRNGASQPSLRVRNGTPKSSQRSPVLPLKTTRDRHRVLEEAFQSPRKPQPGDSAVLTAGTDLDIKSLRETLVLGTEALHEIRDPNYKVIASQDKASESQATLAKELALWREDHLKIMEEMDATRYIFRHIS